MADKGIDEEGAFREIAERMTERFPDVAAARIDEIIATVRAEMATAKVRDFVPVLSEREVKKRIKQERAQLTA